MSLAAVHESGNDVDRGYEQAGGWRRALRRSALKIGMWIALSLSFSLSVIVPVTAQPSLPSPIALGTTRFQTTDAARHRRRGDRIETTLLRLLTAGYGTKRT